LFTPDESKEEDHCLFNGLRNKSCLQGRERPQSHEPGGNHQSVRRTIETRLFDNEHGGNQGPDLHVLAANLAPCQTRKGYQNSYSMDFDVRKIVIPSCENFRNVTPDPTLPVLLIMDNRPSHNKQSFLALYAP
jgi:hypothetical protein